jgi:hypothetical protein
MYLLTQQVRALILPLFDLLAWAHPVYVWLARQVRAQILLLIAWSAWGQPATVVAGTTLKGADLASVRLVIV